MGCTNASLSKRKEPSDRKKDMRNAVAMKDQCEPGLWALQNPNGVYQQPATNRYFDYQLPSTLTIPSLNDLQGNLDEKNLNSWSSGIRNQHIPLNVETHYREKGDSIGFANLPTRASIDSAESSAPQQKDAISRVHSQFEIQMLPYVSHLENFMARYMQYLSANCLRLHKLIILMELRIVKPTLQALFREISRLPTVIPDESLFKVLADSAQQQVRANLNSVSRKLWSSQSAVPHQQADQENVYDALLELFDADLSDSHGDEYWQAVISYLKQRFYRR